LYWLLYNFWNFLKLKILLILLFYFFFTDIFLLSIYYSHLNASIVKKQSYVKKEVLKNLNTIYLGIYKLYAISDNLDISLIHLSLNKRKKLNIHDRVLILDIIIIKEHIFLSLISSLKELELSDSKKSHYVWIPFDI
jgi:hypothetical protein